MDELRVGSNVIGIVLHTKRQPEAQKVVMEALDGTAYAQNTGEAIWKYKIDCYCETFEQREDVDDACNNCDVVSVWKDGVLFTEGYIEDKKIAWKEWEDGHGVSKFTLVKK